MTPEEKSIAYWDARPCNSRHSSAPVGPEYFAQVRWKRHKVEPHIQEFFRKIPKNSKVLEIGCGIGTDARVLAWDKHEVVCVDASPKSCELAEKNLSDEWVHTEGIPRPVVICSTLEKLPQKLGANGQFDVIYSFGAIHHMKSPDFALHLLRYYLKPGGQLRIMLYHKRSWKVGMILLKNFWRLKSPKRLIADHSEAQPGCPITHTYTVGQARKLVNKHFDVESIKVAHIFPYRIRSYVQGRYVLAFPWNILTDRARALLARYIGWHILIVARPKV